MSIPHKDQVRIKIWQIVTIILLLFVAFIQCFKTTHDLHWPFDFDFDRDMAFVQGTLEGDFGKDPNYLHQYLWYNPLLFLTETAIVKLTGLPVNIVLAQAGAYLNLLSPVAFIIMLGYFFNLHIAIAGLISYLFLASGELPAWASATYSPWLYPGSFMQFIFYINIIFCFKAFKTQRYRWFFLSGLTAGIAFLGHTAPAVLIILIMFSMQAGNIMTAIKQKKFKKLQKYFLQGIFAFIPFVLASLPLLYFIIGKYNLHIINRMTFEYFDELFIPINFPKLLMANLSFTLLISIIGFLFFLKNCTDVLLKKILYNWFFISVTLFFYTSMVPVVHHKYHLHLPGLVPSFHFFFYLKALQSVFFGYGFYTIARQIIFYGSAMINKQRGTFAPLVSSEKIFLMVSLLLVIVNLPDYTGRKDFVDSRLSCIAKENDSNKIQVYEWIVKNIPQDGVILCEDKESVFPVMATGRKMVSINSTFSNPYLDFGKREADRNTMLAFLKSGQPDSIKRLFDEYNVSAVLLKNTGNFNHNIISQLFSRITFQNSQYTIFKKI
ncbi:MAG: hypothetical protein ABIT08_03510 [Bacteroidia bacterium]